MFARVIPENSTASSEILKRNHDHRRDGRRGERRAALTGAHVGVAIELGDDRKRCGRYHPARQQFPLDRARGRWWTIYTNIKRMVTYLLSTNADENARCDRLARDRRAGAAVIAVQILGQPRDRYVCN